MAGQCHSEAQRPTTGELCAELRALLARSPFITQPEQEARWIISEAIGQPLGRWAAHPERPVSPDKAQAARALAQRRCAGEPLQYVLGNCQFFGRKFLCDRRAMIPRPETEQLVELALAELRRLAQPVVADVGTGTGCIAITIALERPEARVFATESSPGALALARENAALYNLGPPRLTLLAGDLFAPLPQRVDAVVSNPPYIPTGELDRLGPEIACEPREALDGGPDGLRVIRRIAAQWAAHVRPGGFLLLEVGHDQAQRVVELLGPGRCSVRRDTFGVERFVLARAPEG